MFDVGGAGRAIIFMSAVAGLAIFGALWLTYAAHCFLTILTESSIGDREVRWPDESIADWWWKPLYCVGLLVFWLTAGGAFLWPMAFAGPVWFAVGAGLFLWLAYPVGLLCVLDARNSLAVIHVPLFARLPRYLPAVLFTGLVTLPLGAAAGGLLTGVVLHSVFWAIPAALVLPWALFLYARFWGRLAWLVLNRKVRRSAEDSPPPEAARVTVQDPWEIPREEPIPEVDVEVEEEPVAPAAEDDEWAERPVPYQIGKANAGAGSGGPPAPPPFSHVAYYEDYRKREQHRRDRAEGRKPGQRRRRRATFRAAFGADVWPFLAEWRTLRAAFGLAAATLAFLLVLRVAIATMPPLGG